VSDRQHETGLAGRYATAIFELAHEEKAVELVERDFAVLKTLIGDSTDLARLVHAPVFSRDDQAKGMRAVLARLDACPLTTRIVLTLASKRRLFALADIIRAFENLVARQRGEVHAKVTSARTLTDGQTAELKAVLKAKLGRDPKLEARVDPGLLGGLIVQVGSRMVDSSLRTKLNGIRLAMRGG
jgi:F-type H+-transporting ATPase subunit delta